MGRKGKHWACCPVPSPLKWLRKKMGRNKMRKQLKQEERLGRILLKVGVDNGRLYVCVREANNLFPVNPNGFADPYVEVKFIPNDAKSETTKTAKATLNPIWNESFEFDLSPEDYSKRVLLEVWNGDTTSCSEFMGSLSFCISEITKENFKAEGWFKLLDQKEGELYGIPVIDSINEETADSRKQFSDKSTNNNEMPAAGPSTNQNMREPETVKPSDFNFLTVLGKGCFGRVLLAERKGTNDLYAIKIINKDVIIQRDYVDYTMREKRILALAQNCPFLVHLHYSFQTMDRLYFVMEFVNGGDLMFRMQQQGKFKEPVARFYAAEIALGLFYLHKHGIIYRDLKPENVMLDGDGHIKITDFGMCMDGIFGDKRANTYCGTPAYAAPELLLEQPYGKSVDWWAYGVILYQMLTGQNPFNGEDADELFTSIKVDNASYPKFMTKEAVSICQGFLTKLVPERLGCGPVGESDVKDHAFFKRIKWNRMENREIKPPCKPKIHDPKKAENFDKTFTQLSLTVSPTDSIIIKNINDSAFRNFSCNNLHFRPDSPDHRQVP